LGPAADEAAEAADEGVAALAAAAGVGLAFEVSMRPDFPCCVRAGRDAAGATD